MDVAVEKSHGHSSAGLRIATRLGRRFCGAGLANCYPLESLPPTTLVAASACADLAVLNDIVIRFTTGLETYGDAQEGDFKES